MIKKLFTLALLIALPAMLLAGSKPDPIIGPDSPLPPVINPVPLGPWGPTDDYVGQVYQMGTTWYDYQHNGTTSRQIGCDALGAVHLAWMNGLAAGATNRHIYYNYYAAGAPGSVTGWQISTYRSGYTTMNLNASNIPVVFYHSTVDSNRGVCAWANSYLSSTFTQTIFGMPASNRGLTWPHGTVDHQGFYHAVMQTNPNTYMYYTRSENGGATFLTPFQIDVTTGMAAISQTMAASPINNKVAIVYTHPITTNWQQEDVFYFESTNGTTWNFSSPVNITNFGQPGHPMTNEVRAWGTANALYDNAGNLHIAYTTITYPTVVSGASILWHWSAATGHSKICGETSFSGPYTYCNPGAWHSCWDLACLGIDAAGVLYVSWEQATTAGDVSQSNYGNFEVYVSYSEDNGDTWMAPVDVTNTHTPSAPPGQCMSEAWPTLAEKVDSFLYIEYIQDRDAGGIPQTEGTWTENPVIYQKVPVSAIQTTLVVDLVATLPIVIPPGGGTFSYTANINNPGTNAVVFDVNTEAVLPNGNVYGPILLRNLLSLPAGGSLTRAMTQYVPAGAPAGSYTFRMRVGDYGWNVWVEDSFPFSKSAGWGPSPNVGNWNCYGWDNALEVTAPVPETPLLVTLSPNPFNPATEVTYTLGENSVIKLSVYDISGREVAILTNGYETAGVHKVTFNAGNLASGVYFFTLSNGSELVTVKSLLLK